MFSILFVHSKFNYFADYSDNTFYLLFFNWQSVLIYIFYNCWWHFRIRQKKQFLYWYFILTRATALNTINKQELSSNLLFFKVAKCLFFLSKQWLTKRHFLSRDQKIGSSSDDRVIMIIIYKIIFLTHITR